MLRRKNNAEQASDEADSNKIGSRSWGWGWRAFEVLLY